MLQQFIAHYKYAPPDYVTLIYDNLCKLSIDQAKSKYKLLKSYSWMNSPTDNMELFMLEDMLCIKTVNL